MKTNLTNTELLSRIKHDDKIAFYHLYERFSKRLYSFVTRFIKQEQDAEGIVQEVFLKIWETRHTIDLSSSFESYLFTIAYNTTINLFRKRLSEKKYLEHILSLQKFEKAPDLIDEVQFDELNETIENLLNKLTPRQKEIFKLSRESGMSHQEIAERLNISTNTVKKHIANTLAFLKANLDSGFVMQILFIALFF